MGESSDDDFERRRAIVEAFFQASRDGDFEGLLQVLDPDVVNRVDAFAAPPLGLEIRGASKVAKAASVYSQRTQGRELALINGEIGIIVAPQGRLQIALLLTIPDDKISTMEVISDPARLAQLDIRVRPNFSSTRCAVGATTKPIFAPTRRALPCAK